jgi:hypothetical protein
MQFDIGLCAYTNLLRIVAKFHDDLFSDPNSLNGLNKVLLQIQNSTRARLKGLKSIDFRTITLIHDRNLDIFHNEWKQRFSDSDDGGRLYKRTKHVYALTKKGGLTDSSSSLLLP